jgi:hypothetical protein
MDDPPDVDDGHDLEHLDLAGSRVYRYLRDLRAV